MQIAETLVKQGMTGDTRFNDELSSIVASKGLTKIIETGTYLGQGTTKAIIIGLSRVFHPYDFYSIEVNPSHHKQAVKNIGKVKGVHLINGLSVAKSDLPVSMTFDVPDYIVVDHTDQNRNLLYSNEVSYPVPDKMLDYALFQMNYKPDLVVLDSAGHMGMIEFKYLMERVRSSFILALDDTDHVKHYETMLFIKEHPDKFTILKQLQSEVLDPINGSKFGFAIVQVNGL